MTIGQRIAQKRKELGLSQEALGEKLGVSRQSIYKWESDAALPEIDKLIALSRLFGISIGVLLGVEEQRVPQAPTEDPSGELTEAQLKMVEEITQRYISALPKAAPQKKHPILRVLAVVCILFAGLKFYAKLDQVDNQYRQLTSHISDVQDNVEVQIRSISTQVESILKAQNDLTADHETAIAATDLAKNRVTFSFRAVPKTFTADTIAWLEVTNEGAVETFGPFTPEENQTFRGEVTTQLTDSITLSIVFETGGVRSTQLLKEYTDLYTVSLPTVWANDDLWRIGMATPYVLELPSKYNEGQTVTIPPHCLEGAKQLSENEPAAAPAEIKVGLFKNQELVVWAEPITKPANYQGFEGHLFFKFPEVRVDLSEGDTVCVAALVTDTYGRVFFDPGTPFSPVENGTTLDSDSYTQDNNMENWTFE